MRSPSEREQDETPPAPCLPLARLPRKCRKCGFSGMVLDRTAELELDAEYVCPRCGYRSYC